MGLLVLLFLCTPPAAAGLLVVATMQPGQANWVSRAASLLVAATVAVGVLVLVGFAIAADIGALNRLTGGGPTEGFNGEDTFLIIVAVILTAMATTAVLALWAAWRKRR